MEKPEEELGGERSQDGDSVAAGHSPEHFVLCLSLEHLKHRMGREL